MSGSQLLQLQPREQQHHSLTKSIRTVLVIRRPLRRLSHEMAVFRTGVVELPDPDLRVPSRP